MNTNNQDVVVEDSWGRKIQKAIRKLGLQEERNYCGGTITGRYEKKKYFGKKWTTECHIDVGKVTVYGEENLEKGKELAKELGVKKVTICPSSSYDMNRY